MEPCKTPLVTGHQYDVIPFTITRWYVFKLQEMWYVSLKEEREKNHLKLQGSHTKDSTDYTVEETQHFSIWVIKIKVKLKKYLSLSMHYKNPSVLESLSACFQSRLLKTITCLWKESDLTSSRSSSGVAGVLSVLYEATDDVSESIESSSYPKTVSTTCLYRRKSVISEPSCKQRGELLVTQKMRCEKWTVGYPCNYHLHANSKETHWRSGVVLVENKFAD